MSDRSRPSRPTSPRASDLTEQLFWNRSIQHELLLGSHPGATDPFPTDALAIARNGDLFVVPLRRTATALAGPSPLRTAFLFQGFEVTARFAGAEQVGELLVLHALAPTGTPRLVAYELGRYWDGWLDTRGRPPGLARRREVRHRLVHALAAAQPPRLPSRSASGSASYRLTPGQRTSRCASRSSGAQALVDPLLAIAGASLLADNQRPVSVRSTVAASSPPPDLSLAVTRSRVKQAPRGLPIITLR